MNALTVTNLANDSEPRVLDLDLAARLGFSEPRMIRKLIKAHMAHLQRLGICAAVSQTSGPKGGRPATAYYLNEDQAIYICLSSETQKAKDIKIEVVQAFNEYRRLKAQPIVQAIPTNMVEALRLAADELEKRQKLEQQLIEAQPKITLGNMVASRERTLRDCAGRMPELNTTTIKDDLASKTIRLRHTE